MRSNLSLFSASDVTGRCREALVRVGVGPGDAQEVARSLVLADARGLASHGVSRMGVYVHRIQTGKMSPETSVRVLRESPATALIDGNNGLGVPVALRAMELVSQKAKTVGIAFATIRRSNHFGMAGFIAERAVENGMIGYAASNGPARMPAHGARVPVFGTSPFACAIPTSNGMPIVVDMATCVVARGKIIMAARAGETIPEGWALDEHGQPTTDPEHALAGSVLPFAGPKGSAIALMIEVLAGVIGGDVWGRGVEDLYEEEAGPTGTSHCIAAINVEALSDLGAFTANLDNLIAQIKSDPLTADSPVYLPGEREQLRQLDVADTGLPLAPNVAGELNALLDSLDLPPVEPKQSQGARI